MKVICDRSALLDAVNLVSGVVAARTPRPQLQCVRLSARRPNKAGELVLAATDGEISLRLSTTQVDIQQTGDALIPADKLRQIVSAEDQDQTLTIESEQDACHIRGADAHFKVFGYPPEEFPPIPEFEAVTEGKGKGKEAAAVSGGAGPVASFTHMAGPLSAMIARTLFATARETSRYAINGVLLKRDGKKLEMVATDGRRLAVCRQNLSGGGGDGKNGTGGGGAVSCIVPSKALALLEKLVDDPESPVRIAVTDSQVLFDIGSSEDGESQALLTSNLVEGTFPPYEDVIPKDNDKKVVLDRDVFASAVRRAALLTNEESRGVRLAFDAEKRQLEISSRAPEMGEAHITVDLSSFQGESMEIGFNPAFISDALKVISETEVTMELKQASRPGVIKSGTDFLYVVMPVTLQ